MTSHFIPEATANVWMCGATPTFERCFDWIECVKSCFEAVPWYHCLTTPTFEYCTTRSNKNKQTILLRRLISTVLFCWHNDSTTKSGNECENRHRNAFHTYRKFISAHSENLYSKEINAVEADAFFWRLIMNEMRKDGKLFDLSDYFDCLNPGTNRLINCFSGQIRANIDLSLLKIALAALVQILQTLVNISPN